jgi:hypothetical protein
MCACSTVKGSMMMPARRKTPKISGTDETAVGVMDEPEVGVGFGFPKTEPRPARRCPGSFWKAMFVVEERGMIQVGTLHVDGRALGDGTQLLHRGLTASAPKTLIAFAQGFAAPLSTWPQSSPVF